MHQFCKQNMVVPYPLIPVKSHMNTSTWADSGNGMQQILIPMTLLIQGGGVMIVSEAPSEPNIYNRTTTIAVRLRDTSEKYNPWSKSHDSEAICGMAWAASHPGGAAEQFTEWWVGLSSEECAYQVNAATKLAKQSIRKP
ncbi:hypothetical protein P691DRAFT_790476 [Macrolepiota fuliginosa MF-IS2]|uniref:Uncharacterized protein n=1 Tax=Macrolepiota fuliginosa MF-IS2 TaxID=1400762 RepID=A0A9P5XFL3_9AGAR|nr:hypothetical protein P691DRAFT_790476 [Macrolepiota fuliginosa MF-IS2]